VKENRAGVIALFSLWLLLTLITYSISPDTHPVGIAIAALLFTLILAVPVSFCAGIVLCIAESLLEFRKK